MMFKELTERIKNRDFEGVKVLIQQQPELIDVTIDDELYGAITPLIIAIEYLSVEVAHFLIDKGANIHSVTPGQEFWDQRKNKKTIRGRYSVFHFLVNRMKQIINGPDSAFFPYKREVDTPQQSTEELIEAYMSFWNLMEENSKKTDSSRWNIRSTA